jgi:hypothetical protein
LHDVFPILEYDSKPEIRKLAPKQEASKRVESPRTIFNRLCRGSYVFQGTHFEDHHKCKIYLKASRKFRGRNGTLM